MAFKDYIQSKFLRIGSYNNRKHNPSMNGRTSGSSDKHLLELASEIEWTALDSLFADAGRLIIESDKVSIGMLKRAFHISSIRAHDTEGRKAGP